MGLNPVVMVQDRMKYHFTQFYLARPFLISNELALFLGNPFIASQSGACSTQIPPTTPFQTRQLFRSDAGQRFQLSAPG